MTLPCKNCITLGSCRGYTHNLLKEEWEEKNKKSLENWDSVYESFMELIEGDPSYYLDFFDMIREKVSGSCSILSEYLNEDTEEDRETEFDVYVSAKSIKLVD
jgi:hypothetical protein